MKKFPVGRCTKKCSQIMGGNSWPLKTGENYIRETGDSRHNGVPKYRPHNTVVPWWCEGFQGGVPSIGWGDDRERRNVSRTAVRKIGGFFPGGFLWCYVQLCRPREIVSESCEIWLNFGCYLHFFQGLIWCIERNFVCCAISIGKSLITIQIWFEKTRFRKDFSVLGN